MNPSELFKTALLCRKTDRVPLWEIEFHLWNRFSDVPIVIGEEFVRLSAKEKEYIMHRNAEVMAETADRLHFSGVTALNGYWEIAPGVPSYYWMPDEWRMEQNRLLAKALREYRIASVGIASAVICMPGSGDTYLDYCYRMFDDPDSILKDAEAVSASGIETAKRYADMGFEAVVSPSDIADSRGQFFNDEQFESWILPFINRFADEAKKAGVLSILHTDGNIMKLIDRIADTGLNAVQAIDPTAGMTMRGTKEIVGNRLCLCGNVDVANLLLHTPEEIRKETTEILETAKDYPGITAGASNACMAEMSAENYLALADTVWNYTLM